MNENLRIAWQALQDGIIEQQQFLEACAAWRNDPTLSLSRWLIERGLLTAQMQDDLLQRLHGTQDYRSDAAATLDETIAALDPAAVVVKGTTADRYERLSLHGRGGIGDVWLTRDRHLLRQVALKELRRDRSASARDRQSFVREARITCQLEHPGIVPIYELADDEQNPFYTMRFLSGQTLHAAIQEYHSQRASGQSPRRLRDLLQAFVAVCNAVAYAHARGVVHRDLKGQNIALGDFGEVIVLDWGLATVSQQDAKVFVDSGDCSDTFEGGVAGTPAFMAPEQAAGQAIDSRTDVYGLGAILYSILAGRPPFVGDNVHELLARVREQPPDPPRKHVPQAPLPLQAICLKALAKEPKDRYQSARALAEDVQRWLADEPVSAQREPLSQRLGRWARKHQPIVAGSLAMLVTAVIGLAVSTALIGRAKAETDRAYQLAEQNRRAAEKLRQLAEANARDALAKKQDADVQRGLALDHFRLARQAVDRLHTQVSENQLMKIPGLQPLRKELLKSAQEFYEKLAARKSQDTALQADHARAQTRLAMITYETGALQEAIALGTQGLATFDSLPTTGDHLGDMAKCLHWLGSWHHLSGATARAEMFLQRALDINRQRAARQDSTWEIDASQRSIYSDLAVYYQETGRRLQAEQMYRAAIKLGEKLLDGPAAEDGLRYNCIITYVNMGNILREVSKFDEGEQYYEKGIRLAKELAERDANVPQFEAKWGWAISEQSYARFQASRLAEARTGFEKAQQLQKKVAEANPSVHNFRHEWAITCNNLALLHMQRSDIAAAVPEFERCVVLFDELSKSEPDTVAYQNGLAACLLNLGSCYFLSKDAKRAEAVTLRCVKVREALLPRQTTNLEFLAQLGSSYNNLGYFCHERRALKESLEWFARAQKTLEPILQKAPEYRQAQEFLAKVYPGQGQTLSALGRHDEALRAWDQALARSKADQYELRIYRGVTLAHLRKHAEAAKEIDGILKATSYHPAVLYNAACVLSLAAAVAADDAALSEPDRRQKAEEYAKQAMQTLLRAEKIGVFRAPEAAQSLETDADFTVLRPREDFQMLLKRLKR